MTYDDRELRDLIPLYVNDTLPNRKRREFEDKLNEYPELRREYEEFSRIKASYADMEQELPQPSETVYRRVMAGIKGEAKIVEISLEPGILSKVREFFSQVFASPRLSWAVVAIQLVVILGLTAFITEEGHFTTLSSDDPLKGDEIAINIVFDEEAREKEIRAVLNHIGAVIIDGPSTEGLYIIKVEKDNGADQILKELEKFSSVKFAAEAY